MTTANQISAKFDRELISGNMKSAMKSVDAKSRDLWMVSPSALTIMPDFNVRPKNAAYHEQVRQIADSIKSNGFYSHKAFAVIVIKEAGKDVLAVYDGHTRYDALQLAISEGFQAERVPCIAAPAGTSLEDITIGLHTNNNGSPLDPLGLGVVMKRLQGYGLEPAEIATKLSFTVSYVNGLLSLQGAPKKLRDMVADEKVSATLAIATLRDHGETAIAKLEAGLVTAKANGKSKVTKKTLAAPKVSVVDKGLEWIAENGNQETSFALLSHLTGKSIAQLKKLI